MYHKKFIVVVWGVDINMWMICKFNVDDDGDDNDDDFNNRGFFACLMVA